MEKKIMVGGIFNSSINFAMQQNSVPVFRNLILTNQTDCDLCNVKVRLTFEPEFACAFEETIAVLSPEKPVEISPVHIIVSSEFLFSLTEKMKGNVHIEVFCEDESIYSEFKEIELLAYDEWTGILVIPEIISAFVTPNHPKVAELVAKAGVFLQKWTGNPSFTGYQTKNPNIAKNQAAAIYAALQAENIAYNMPPASYETIGQRVRLPHTVLEQKNGTCIDLAVLYVSCLEAVGLNPLLVFTHGHAFAGVWLEEETFAECVEDDISALTKRTADGIDSIYLVECTDFVAGKKTDFDHAGKHADSNLDNPSEFDFAVDVRRCRGSGIRPIPTRIIDNGIHTTIDYGTRSENEITNAPREIDLSLHGVTSEEKREVTRETIWERKLLDLSLKNSLLNFRPTASNIQFMTTDLGKLEDEISHNEYFKIMPVPNDFTLNLSDSKIFEIENEKDVVATIAETEFASRRLRTFIPQTELDKTLKKLYRQSKVSLEENGANTLYLALGFLRWFETEKSERPRFAPLVLVPVDIIKKIQDRSYSIKIRDEEIQMNITLLEMLRQDFGLNIEGLNPLPQDDSGINLPLVFNTVRQGVMSKKHWDIVEAAFLGQFSFSQFIMWNDIRSRADDLKNNKVVASLISGKLEWEPEDISISARELDENVSPCDMAVPTSADSSQLAAIYEASRGQSFVLHGPPGTGKSQTITNMIANALYNGNSVLFVAEKMAALSVVQKRLAAIGLAPFCLELHSNKTQKKNVLSQLENTFALGHIKAPIDYRSEESRLHALRSELNDVMTELYKKRSLGISVFDAISELEGLDCEDSVISFTTDFVMGATPDKYTLWNDAVRDVSVAGKELGGYDGCALKNIRMTAYSPDTKEQLVKTSKELLEQISVAKSSYDMLPLQLLRSFSGYKQTVTLIDALLSAEYILEKVITEIAYDVKKHELEKIISDGKEYTAIQKYISESFEQSVFGYDFDKALLKWREAQQQWFLPKSLVSNKLIKEINIYAKPGIIITKLNIEEFYYKLSTMKQLKERISSASEKLTCMFGEEWAGVNSDFPMLSRAMEVSEKIRLIVYSTFEYKNILLEVTRNIIGDHELRNKISVLFPRTLSAYNDVIATTDTLRDKFGVDIPAVTQGDNWFESAASEANAWVSHIDDIKPRILLENALEALRTQGLSDVSEAYTGGQVDESTIVPSFRHAICKAVVSAAYEYAPALAKFQGASFEDTIAKYEETADMFQKLTIQELVERLSSRIPSSASTSAGSSEIAMLQKAIHSKGRMMSIRKLFDSIPNLLRRICPCMLMSPISVAQYIDPSFPKFDLVIFDEASQMPTCEAVGAIARGENVVVVGDPKQLPPTSFFTANRLDEENIEKEDLESVLDDCLALAMPQKHLLWHYRSRHESLIAYSNAKFYDNKLYTFPSPDDMVSDIEWIKVDGYYDKGGTKQNRAEAEAIVKEIVRRLMDINLRMESIGVVTFSVVQQNLIDDMLSEEFCRNPQLELYADAMYEPIIVKNLENVQGDERDVILFSIGYGPDKDGKVSMNFGPLNRDGGWRRLNVAISRARKGMKVYSVISPEQIDVSRTRSDGVAALKGFLEFAAKGRSALPVRAESSTSGGNGFEKSVAEAVEALGYEVRCEIGSSEYKIDIGVVNPDKPDEYLLGIICGNESIFNSTTARDRNILQPKILSGLGWTIHTVYILDWYDNRQKCIVRIVNAIDVALANYRANPAPVISEAPEPVLLSFEKEEVLTTEDKCVPYSPYVPQTVGSSEKFYEITSKGTIAGLIQKIAETEAPVSRKKVLKYILSSYGITRSGSKVEAVFAAAVSCCGLTPQKSNGTEFFWGIRQTPSEYSLCRLSDEKTEKRAFDDICTEEICNGIMLILGEQISMQKTDIIRETAKLFGYSRVSGVINTSVESGIEYAVSSGKAILDGDRIMLKEDA